MSIFNWVEKFTAEKEDKSSFLIEKDFWIYFAVEIEFVSWDQKLLVANWDLSTQEWKRINELFLNRYTLIFHKLFNINAVAYRWIWTFSTTCHSV